MCLLFKKKKNKNRPLYPTDGLDDPAYLRAMEQTRMDIFKEPKEETWLDDDSSMTP